MTTTILLARHGQTDSNINGFYMGSSNEDLNEVGYTQARKLSTRLASLPISSIYTSPLQRTRTTAAILSEPHKLELEVLDDLIEVRLGDWQGLHIDEINRRWPQLWQQWRTDPTDVQLPNGESFKQVVRRGIRAFETVREASGDKEVLIVTHDIIVKVIASHVLGAPSSIYRKFDINNASLSVIRFADNKPRLISLNDTSHLEN